jgi:hypothetical protein
VAHDTEQEIERHHAAFLGFPARFCVQLGKATIPLASEIALPPEATLRQTL